MAISFTDKEEIKKSKSKDLYKDWQNATKNTGKRDNIIEDLLRRLTVAENKIKKLEEHNK